MTDNEQEEHKGVPEWLGKMCGALAGGAACWKAGEAAAMHLDNYLNLPNAFAKSEDGETVISFSEGGASLLEPAFGALGVWAGYSLGGKNPNKGLLILAGMVGSQYLITEVSAQVQELNRQVATFDPQPGSTEPLELSASVSLDDPGFSVA